MQAKSEVQVIQENFIKPLNWYNYYRITDKKNPFDWNKSEATTLEHLICRE
jgi:hypothetical protein